MDPRSSADRWESSSRGAGCDEGRTLAAERRCLLEGVGDAEQGRLLKRLADELDRDRQSAGAKPGADRDRRVAGDVERHRKIGPVEQVPFWHFVDLRRFGGL